MFRRIADYNKVAKLNLRRFLTTFIISDDDNESPVNFVSYEYGYRKRFFIPNAVIDKLFHLVQECASRDISNGLYEIQDMNDNNVSGLTFDFDFTTKEDNFTIVHLVEDIIKNIFDILHTNTEMPTHRHLHSCFYLRLQQPQYDAIRHMYLHRFRIVIPGLMMTASDRLNIMNRIWVNKMIMLVFANRNNLLFPEITDEESRKKIFRDCFSRHTRLAPVPIHGCFNPDDGFETPFYIEKHYKVTTGTGTTDFTPINVGNIDNIPDIARKLSIVHTDEYIIVPINDMAKAKEMKSMSNKDGEARLLFYNAYDEAHKDFMLRSVLDETQCEIMQLISIFNAKRFMNREKFMQIISALSSEGDRYKSIATKITKQRFFMLVDTDTNVFNSFKSYEEFETAWNTVINSEEIGNKFSINSIAFWAQMDSPSKFSSYSDKLLTNMMIKHVSDIINLGELDQKQFAEYLFCRFGHEFVSYTQVKRVVYWCEFVLPRTLDKKPGQLYKWRYLGNQPDGLSLFLNKLSDIVKIVLSEMRSVMASLSPDKENKDDEILFKTIKSHMHALIKSSKKLNNFSYKQGVINEAGVLFKRNVFMERMDQDPNIMGVGNGVLEFCRGSAKLITHYHMYPISKYSPTKYVEYNPECPYVKTVWKMLTSLVPEDEFDALEFLLYYFSTSLDGFPKESLFLIIHGGGSNGKSVLLDILSKTIGSDYAVKLPLAYITEQSRNKAANADPATMLLEHSRLTYFSESDRNEKVNVAIVKEISGGEPLTGRKLYEDLRTFTPKTNYVLTTNHLLSIETQEYAVWRRFMSYSFKICFKNNANPENKFERERDDDLINTIKNDGRYLSAMLSILVEYRRKLYDEYDGKLMKVPRPTIIRETEEYRQKEDIFARYISQRVVYMPDRTQTLDEVCTLFRSYYRSENGGMQYSAKSQELIQIFKNTALAKHIRDRDGIPILVDFFVIADGETVQPGMILFNEWEKRNQS